MKRLNTTYNECKDIATKKIKTKAQENDSIRIELPQTCSEFSNRQNALNNTEDLNKYYKSKNNLRHVDEFEKEIRSGTATQEISNYNNLEHALLKIEERSKFEETCICILKFRPYIRNFKMCKKIQCNFMP